MEQEPENVQTIVYAACVLHNLIHTGSATTAAAAATVNKQTGNVTPGFGLAFIAYPEALTHLPWAPLWSVLFFFMLLTLGLDSQFAGLETILTSLLDQFPKMLKLKRIYMTSGICLLFYFLGLVIVTEAGIYWLNLIDYFCTGWILLIVALLEVTGLSWIYGINRFIKDIEMMIGSKIWFFWLWWRVCWFFISPSLLAVRKLCNIYWFRT
ncbi:sodium- and chloride-dependent neutral and basic amino acid transporter B(0+)-like [Amblyraja radiata]|uniref:sodium- and chloride-dependent neutral and basic amino acid transporter B(0+)-like n=1 Tax=Amblyraja radiata TaxID=386614 RepID=UPI001403F352|nr:sodium- and chloride-dependent neutral and basic amino acid transporter B(0+)-like [Amblyraja radiata]